ncbi:MULTISPECIES: antiterminator Q family protein [unclassified Acinetobacter]|uniref:antiterminator Q family protein n=1 Tax=unclassified Acinetobacter TaxID=196816 RepID=UPI0015D311B0|nr:MULTISPECIES: antiterminator Q family protein [unclassified Acinetobacter]
MSAIVEVKPTVRMMQNELAQWGKWARHASYNPSELTYTSPTYGLMRLKEGVKSSGVQVVLDDDALVAIDHLVTQLRFSRPDLYQWIEFHYLKGYPIAVLASKTKAARYKIDGYLLAAESWLDCQLDFLVKNNEM